MTTATTTDPMTEAMTTCIGCGMPISAEMYCWCFGRCYQCQCIAHANGEIDMDATDGIEDREPQYEAFHDEDYMTEEEIAIRDGRAEPISASPANQYAREQDRLVEGVYVSLTVKGDCSWEIPF